MPPARQNHGRRRPIRANVVSQPLSHRQKERRSTVGIAFPTHGKALWPTTFTQRVFSGGNQKTVLDNLARIFQPPILPKPPHGTSCSIEAPPISPSARKSSRRLHPRPDSHAAAPTARQGLSPHQGPALEAASRLAVKLTPHYCRPPASARRHPVTRMRLCPALDGTARSLIERNTVRKHAAQRITADSNTPHRTGRVHIERPGISHPAVRRITTVSGYLTGASSTVENSTIIACRPASGVSLLFT